MTEWAQCGTFKSSIRNDKITIEIERSMGQLDACSQNLQIATQLQLFSLNTQMDAAREPDQPELRKMMLKMRENQELRENPGLSLIDMEKFTEAMKTFQLELRSYPPGSSTHDGISRGLLGMQRISGQLLPIAILEGHECKIISRAPIAGSMVYEGLWLGEEKVAIKVLRNLQASGCNVQRFHERVNIWHRMNSKYILRFYGVASTARGSFWLVNPWCENGDAPKYLKKKPNADRLKLILEIAYGLRYLHSQSPPIAHGSLRGSNVLIGDGGGALLTDFGLSKALDDLTAAVRFTQSTGVNGYYRWVAPELYEDDGQMTPKSDIYSWGMTALELYSDKVPYSQIRMFSTVMREVAKGKIPERPRPGANRMSSTTGDGDGIEIPDRLWELLVRCWANDPVNRPTVQEVIQELEDMGRHESTSTEV
ncbi:hypothetical protein FRC11_000445 [Ceratobasidium sp. 423]|nr:hypothetical protein FRC11_000445 [Ceratobasidium sp. 423]